MAFQHATHGAVRPEVEMTKPRIEEPDAAGDLVQHRRGAEAAPGSAGGPLLPVRATVDAILAV